MNLVKTKNPTFTSLIDELFLNQDWGQNQHSLPAVNILEADDHFDIQLAAPGKEKKEFNIELDEGLLTISSEQESSTTESKGSFTRKEFSYNSFRRSFNVPDTVAADKVSAWMEAVQIAGFSESEADKLFGRVDRGIFEGLQIRLRAPKDVREDYVDRVKGLL